MNRSFFLRSLMYMVILMQKGETPVTIPNTAVKPFLVDDTGATGAGKVNWCHHIHLMVK